jgi:hypothetical protein
VDDEERGYSAPAGTKEPDAWVLLHGPVFVFGPLPRRDWLEQVMAAWTCDCVKEIRPLWFPEGVVMMMGVEPALGDPYQGLHLVH